MANTIPSEFSPFVVGALAPGREIQVGGQTSSPYLRGVVDMASNHNWLLARSGHVQVNQSGEAAIVYAGSVIPFAVYPYYIHKLSQRDELTVIVTGSASAGTFQFRAVTSAGTSAWSASTASGSVNITAAAQVVNEGTGAGDRVTLEFQMSGAATFTVTRVQIYSRNYTGTLDTLTAAGAAYQTSCVPQDTDQYGADKALSVTQVRDLISGANKMFRGNRRAVVNWCAWTNYTNIDTYDGGIAVPYVNDRVQPVTAREFMITPRDGVRRYLVETRARVDNYSGSFGPGVVALGFAGRNGYYRAITSAASTWDTTSLPLEANIQGVRDFVQLRGKAANDAAEDLYIHAVAIFDYVEDI